MLRFGDVLKQKQSYIDQHLSLPWVKDRRVMYIGPGNEHSTYAWWLAHSAESGPADAFLHWGPSPSFEEDWELADE